MTTDHRDHPVYLHDGVYARFDGFQIWLEATRGYDQPERIALDPTTLAMVNSYAKRVGMVQADHPGFAPPAGAGSTEGLT